MPTDLTLLGKVAIECLKRSAIEASQGNKETVIYCDLAGNNLTAEQYCNKLDEDESFAKDQVQVHIYIPPQTKPSSGISVREQRHLAQEIAMFYDKNGMKSDLFNAFVQSRPVIAAAYSRNDLTKIKDTLHFEHGINVQVPTPEFLDDICRKNGLTPYSNE
ncbi:hypothetical protein HY484_02915 [Candidatus Woesearchaeota archaeon]|nr:hypothetical protein [Candidatus Woesearchaeota archaeon]